jgi:hypothetical protein
MERTCALIFPPLGFAVAPPATLLSAFALSCSLIACCSILWIGAEYWRAVWKRLNGESHSMKVALGLAERWRHWTLGFTIFSAAVCAFAIDAEGLRAASVAALLFSVLAALEYVNYFHVQLQNFDHWPTFSRFAARLTFERSHLAQELLIFRRRSRSGG